MNPCASARRAQTLDSMAVRTAIVESRRANASRMADLLFVGCGGKNGTSAKAPPRRTWRTRRQAWSQFFGVPPTCRMRAKHVTRGVKPAGVTCQKSATRFDPVRPLCVFRGGELGVTLPCPATPRQIPADATDRFGRHPEVRREHPLRAAPRDGGVDAQELEVARLRRRGERVDDPLVLGGGVTLQAAAEGFGVAGDLRAQPPRA